MTRLAMKELIGSCFISQNPHVEVEYKTSMADSILEMIDSAYIPYSAFTGSKPGAAASLPLRKELENAKPDESISQQ